MITNEQQYQTTKQRLDGFKKALAMLNAADNQLKQKNPVLWQLNLDTLYSFIDDFTAQLQQYEDLINCDGLIAFTIHDLEDLPRVLISARLAAKISQAQVAEQFQRYEDWEYQEATLSQLSSVCEYLGIKFQPTANITFSATQSA